MICFEMIVFLYPYFFRSLWYYETGQENIPLNQIENDEIPEITNLLEIPENDNSSEIYLKSSPPTQHVHYIPNIPCENSWTCTGMNTIHSLLFLINDMLQLYFEFYVWVYMHEYQRIDYLLKYVFFMIIVCNMLI